MVGGGPFGLKPLVIRGDGLAGGGPLGGGSGIGPLGGGPGIGSLGIDRGPPD